MKNDFFTFFYALPKEMVHELKIKVLLILAATFESHYSTEKLFVTTVYIAYVYMNMYIPPQEKCQIWHREHKTFPLIM